MHLLHATSWGTFHSSPGHELTLSNPTLPLPCLADLADVCPDIASQLAPGGSGRTVTQAVVDAVVALLESDAFAAPLPGSPAAAAVSSGEPAAAAGRETAALRFLAAHLASNRAVVRSAVLLRVLGHLAQPPAVAAAASGDMRADEREAVFCDVITAAAAGLGPADRQQVRGKAMCGSSVLRICIMYLTTHCCCHCCLAPTACPSPLPNAGPVPGAAGGFPAGRSSCAAC